ncbi:DNA helicase MCM8 [Strongylocentrotus purpuratus]|uniref:DNA helicase MCM8 n=1 Tax=Strongylocentrotus purpuratus TaxID=7668 RepID=A0A7M7PR06_STRPU|nr:DNA helicase MCM8 [Strongylocentrotus purpuratus]
MSQSQGSSSTWRGGGGGGGGGGARGRGAGRGTGWRGRGNNRGNYFSTYQSNGRGGGGGGWRGQEGGNRGRGGWRGRGGGGRGSWNNRGRGGGFGNNVSSNATTVSSTRHIEMENIANSLIPYKGWRLYFTDETYSSDSPTVTKIETFEMLFRPRLPKYDKTEIDQRGSILVDCKELLEDETVKSVLPTLKADIRDMPQRIINCLGVAFHQVWTKDLEQQAAVLQEQENSESQGSVEIPPMLVQVPLIHARILNYEPTTAFKNLKANCYGKFVSVKGTVVRVSNIRPLCTKMAFQCNTCGDIQIVHLPNGKYILPTKCLAPECRGRSFVPKQKSPLTETADWQTIKLQEIVMDEQREAGRIPRTVECELMHDLVDNCVPGDTVTVSGIVKVSNVDEGKGRNKDKCMFLLYIHANSLSNLKKSKKGSDVSGGIGAGAAVDFSIKELYAIQEIQSQENLFKLIIGSLCPTIYGHELVKAGLILGLLGGTHKYTNDKNRIPVRGDPHILVVGDPGLGKSQMLQAASNVAPRGVYVCGNTTTTSGLTVTLTKDGSSGDYSLEAGALVLGDQGCCCIDEFDKMGSQHQALLEAMEQQSISIAKAGVVCSLPARTSILAAANPVGGHYNKAKTVSENLKMSGPLLSRFDLVFILLDKPDEEMDSLLSEHVMALHAGKQKAMSGVRVTRHPSGSITTSEDEDARRLWESERPLSERLKVGRGEAFDPIPSQLLRKYIAYARKYVYPKLMPEAATVLQNFYLELRRQHQGMDSTPITTRQLESLMRLTEARARLELREQATLADAEDVVELMKFSMIDTYSDQFGFLDFQRSQHGSGMSSKSLAKRFVAVLNKVAERTYNNIFTMQHLRELAQEANIQVPDFDGFIASLNNQNYLLKKGPRVFQLQTASF